jgi:hypothetical protein
MISIGRARSTYRRRRSTAEASRFEDGRAPPVNGARNRVKIRG